MSSFDTVSHRPEPQDRSADASSGSLVDMRNRSETQFLGHAYGSGEDEAGQDAVSFTTPYGIASSGQQSADNLTAGHRLLNAIDSGLQRLEQEAQQLFGEIADILEELEGSPQSSGESSGGSACDGTGCQSSGDSQNNGASTGGCTPDGAGSGGATAGEGSSGSSASSEDSGNSSTPAGDSGTTGGSSPTFAGQGPATISTPEGTATVGSTATVFGPQAMPSATPVVNAFYVSADATGNGNGTLGSSTNPFSTLQQAQQAMEGSNIKTAYVEGGTYDLSSTLNLTSADSGESFIAAPGSSQPAVIDGQGNVSNLVDVNGANNVTLEGLALQNTQSGSIFSDGDWTQSGTAGDAIVAQNSTGDNFSYNQISNVGMGLDMRGVSNSQFVGNAISDVQEAISLSSASTNSDNDAIDSNSISNVSDVTSSPYGAISLMQASNDTIGNNVIDNVTGAGIRVGGNIGQDSNADVVTQNTVENTNTAAVATSSYSGQGDNGAIYAWQGPGNTNNMDLTISNNYIANAGQGFENIGVYLDDGVDGATVTGNVIQPDGMGWATDIHGGSNNTIENNVMDLSSSTGNEKALLYQNDGPQMTGNNVSGNIIYSSTANGGAYTFYDNSNDTPIVANNDYQGVATPSQDSNPISADPQFIDPSDGDYAVQAGSPAAAIGF